MESGSLSRRELLQSAGLTAASIGAAGGIAGIVSACGEEAGTKWPYEVVVKYE